MIMTSVEGSGFAEQENKGSSAIKQSKAGNRNTSRRRTLRIRDLPQHRPAFCPSSGRHVRCPPVPSFVSQNRKRHGLFGLRRQSELVRQSQRHFKRLEF